MRTLVQSRPSAVFICDIDSIGVVRVGISEALVRRGRRPFVGCSRVARSHRLPHNTVIYADYALDPHQRARYAELAFGATRSSAARLARCREQMFVERDEAVDLLARSEALARRVPSACAHLGSASGVGPHPSHRSGKCSRIAWSH